MPKEDINTRFNKQVIDVENGLHTGLITLGKPGPVLLSAGLAASELYIREAVLRSHMKKHGLRAADLQNLPLAVQTPLMVYEWGCKAKSLVVITGIETADRRKVTAVVKLERQGRKLEVNELASIHGKDVGYFFEEMFDAKLGGLGQSLKYVDKKKTLDWLGIAPPKGASPLTRQEFPNPCLEADLTPPKGADVRTKARISITKIIQNFENPK